MSRLPEGTGPWRGAGRLGVVIPARDEEELLPSCLRALTVAAEECRSPVRVVVVADRCTDRTVEVARAAGAEVLDSRCDGGNVGAARGVGVRWLLAEAARAGVPPELVWVASTDADSTVPPDWLTLHDTAAESGVDALVGTVAVGDWAGFPPDVVAMFEGRYTAWKGAGPSAVHPHVHGANLGVRGSAYLACGGFPSVPVSEDVALVLGLEALGAPILRTPASPVLTSARRRPRAQGGFGSVLEGLAPERSRG